MITMKTCERLWHCHREIEMANKLLSDMEKAEKEAGIFDRSEGKLEDAFGRKRDLQLGIPSGSTGHRLFNVAPELAKSIIRAHVANKKAELIEANEQARIELGDHPCPPTS